MSYTICCNLVGFSGVKIYTFPGVVGRNRRCRRICWSQIQISARDVVTENKVQYPMTDCDEKVKRISDFQLLEFGRNREWLAITACTELERLNEAQWSKSLRPCPAWHFDRARLLWKDKKSIHSLPFLPVLTAYTTPWHARFLERSPSRLRQKQQWTTQSLPRAWGRRVLYRHSHTLCLAVYQHTTRITLVTLFFPPRHCFHTAVTDNLQHHLATDLAG
jgi:hypothetical protein